MSRGCTRGRVHQDRVHRKRRGRVRTSGVLLLVLALAAGVATVLGLLGQAPASADEPEALASITLTSVNPSLPKRDGSITLRGKVTNTSKEPLVRLQALFWRDQSPITNADGLDSALDSDSNQPVGSRRYEKPGEFQDLYTTDQPDLAPGRSATFTVTADVSDLALAPTDGVYLVGVHVLQNGVPVAVARTRIFVPVLSKEPARSSQKATLVVLTTRPSFLGPGLLSDDHLARDVGPGGTLRVLLDAAARKDASYAVDPALVAELETMRGGYSVRIGDAGTTAGQGQAAATGWLSDLAALRAGHDGYRLLFGSPDVAALAHAHQTDVLRAAAAAGRRVQSTEDLPLLVLPADGAADAATLQAAAALDPRAVLLSDSATRGAGPLLRSSSGTPVLTYTAGGLGGGPGPDPRNDTVHIKQRSLATSWIETTSAAGAGPAQVHLVQTRAQATSTSQTDPPWSEATGLSSVLDRAPTRWSGDLRYPGSASDEELTPAQLSGAARLAGSERTWQDLLADGDAAAATADAATARAASTAWRGHRSASAAYLAPQQASLDVRLTSQVRISSSPKASTTAQQGVVFPITIRNDLAPQGDGGTGDPAAIRVRLEFVSSNKQRLEIDPITPSPDGVLGPGKGFTGNARVTARANGTVPVVAQLYTESGRKVGRPVTIEVRVTQNGTTGWAIAVVAGIVLIASTTWRIRQRSRERTRDEAAAGGDQDMLGSVPASELGPEHDDAPVGS